MEKCGYCGAGMEHWVDVRNTYVCLICGKPIDPSIYAVEEEVVEVDEYDGTRPGMSWDIDGMTISVKDHGKEVMRIFLGEAIESTPRCLVESHIQEIERSTWIDKWHKEVM